MKEVFSIWVLLSVGLAFVAGVAAEAEVANSDVAGVAAEAEVSNSDVRCVIVPPLPGSVAREADAAIEQAYCGIDFGDTSVAVCPKTWSTSPGAVVYDLAGTQWQGRAGTFERQACVIGGHARDRAKRELGVFKNSLNGQKTSGTYAPASLLYYHLSRVLDTHVQVPVAVVMEFPVANYAQKVVQPGVEFTLESGSRMLHAGWLEMQQALAAPQSYAHRRAMFSADNQWMWGVMLISSGKRYGEEINGTRASGWGEGQNRDFQKTAPFLALRSDLPLKSAVERGLLEARTDPQMAAALPGSISPQQLAWWLNDITEIVILDTILGQQDRIGNIDFLRRWVWSADGLRMGSSRPSADTAVSKLKVSQLNDNDAGVYSGYANYASKTGMLDDWYHMAPALYGRLQELAADFSEDGPAAQAIRQNYRLPPREAQAILTRTRDVAASLRQRCQAGQLRFDLGLENLLAPEQAKERPVDC